MGNRAKMENSKKLTKEILNKEYGELHVHEALDRIFIQLQSLEIALDEHPVIKQDKRSQLLYRAAIDSLAELYQHLGSISADDA